MIRKGMRTRRSLQRTVWLRKRSTSRTNEGASVESWGEAQALTATVWQASGRVQAEMYGERLTYIKMMEYEGDEAISVNDGICVDVDGDTVPDYKVIAANTDHSPKLYTLEARIEHH